MVMVLAGNGSITGASSLVGNLSITGTANVSQGLTTASRGISNASVPAGCILQVLSTTYSSQYIRTSATSSWVATPLTLNITPTFTSSKILITVTTRLAAAVAHNMLAAGILRNGSLIGATMQTPANDGYGYAVPITLQYLDSPSTTSAVTYALGSADLNNDGATFYMNRSSQGSTTEVTSDSNIVLMEVAQ